MCTIAQSLEIILTQGLLPTGNTTAVMLSLNLIYTVQNQHWFFFPPLSLNGDEGSTHKGAPQGHLPIGRQMTVLFIKDPH